MPPLTQIQAPKFITPLSWIVVLMATIKNIDSFYDYKGAKSIIVLIVGLSACIIFLNMNLKKDAKGKAGKQVRTLYLLGFFASLFLLVLPSSFDLIYPKLIESKLIRNKLGKYLSVKQKPAFFISTQRSKITGSLVNIYAVIEDKNYNVATTLLQEADKNLEQDDNLLRSFSNFLHAKIHIDQGQFNEALNLINDNLKKSENNNDDYWARFNAINLNLKANALSRQLEGVESPGYLIIYDKAIEEANKIKDKKMIANFNLSKTSALYRVALANKSDSMWEVWGAQSQKTISLFHALDTPDELDAISNNLNGLRTRYSQIFDIDTADKRLDQLLSQHDKMFTEGEKIIAQKSIDNITSNYWIINSILFDYFTRTPVASNDFDAVYKRLLDIQPKDGNEDYQFIAQWHQVCGLIQNKRGYNSEARKELLKALSIWHENKQIAKERELSSDLLDYIFSNPVSDRKNRVELLFRWAGLKLLQRNFDPDQKNKTLFISVLKKFEEEGLISKSSVRFIENQQ